MVSIYALLSEFPSAKAIANAHLTKLTTLLYQASKGRYTRETAILFRESARNSIGSRMPAKSLELRHTIKLIKELDNEIEEIEVEIKRIMDEIDSPILSIPGIGLAMGAIIIAEIGDFTSFSSPDKILAYAGLSPSTYQSGNFTAGKTPMVKRGSSYLRWALLNAARLVSMRDETFKLYCQKKKSEGKHHFVVMSHVGKKLVRVVFQLLKTNNAFISQNN